MPELKVLSQGRRASRVDMKSTKAATGRVKAVASGKTPEQNRAAVEAFLARIKKGGSK